MISTSTRYNEILIARFFECTTINRLYRAFHNFKRYTQKKTALLVIKNYVALKDWVIVH